MLDCPQSVGHGYHSDILVKAMDGFMDIQMYANNTDPLSAWMLWLLRALVGSRALCVLAPICWYALAQHSNNQQSKARTHSGYTARRTYTSKSATPQSSTAICQWESISFQVSKGSTHRTVPSTSSFVLLGLSNINRLRMRMRTLVRMYIGGHHAPGGLR